MNDAFLGRQAIFDAALRVHAYELLYRVAGVGGDSESIGGRLQSAARRLMGEEPCFVELTRGHLSSQVPLPLAPERVIGEVRADVPAAPDVVRGLVRLKSKGIQIALKNYVHMQDGKNILLRLCDYIEVDARVRSQEELGRLADALEPTGARLVLENVETIEQLRTCEALGYELFQGTFLTKRLRTEGDVLPTSSIGPMKLLEKFLDPDSEIDELEDLIGQEPGLAGQLLRYANSAHYAPQQPIQAIGQMLMMLGLEVVRRFVSWIAMLEVSGENSELPAHALIRARMCEALAERRGLHKPVAYYTTGLFSTLDALTGTSLEGLLDKLAVSGEIEGALLRGEGDLGAALRCVQAFEVGEWDAAVYDGLGPNDLSAVFAESVEHCTSIRVGMPKKKKVA